MWNTVVEVMRMLIATYAQICGGNFGWGILLASLTFRATLFPLSLKLAKESRKHQEAMQRIKPELDRIRQEYRDRPDRLNQHVKSLLERNNISLLPVGLLASLAQIPLFVAFYSAVRRVAQFGGKFLWVGNIAKPDLLLVAGVTAITCGAVYLAKPHSSLQGLETIYLLVPVAFTAIFLIKASAGVAIYFGVSSAISALQSHILRQSTV
jgi:YidC/Oxa1 family membrane protein insertase